ncbi:multidrug effflux MFS transporter [Enterovirga rhinocerotis]|uniref:DHA1 family bicyclomycin/chloramphenicol resistance-like MFS transporter n=1 Tax=Enterovirga rhinocerotis TaxID=1339210 RepID=A0A4R7CCC3_9HYPH|nr:multidrug effflux MFS transporter [Enterovirga rhinocerotis]TDR94796.1 DHA1 family bicyclomycin/chloramphenicol resistance-like MFS transporter [Enterovirga rhinocerotis]
MDTGQQETSRGQPGRPNPGFAEFVTITALMMGVTAFAVDGILPAFPILGRDFDVADPNRLQLVVYVYMLGFGFAQLIYGPASDVFGRRRAYLAGLGIFLLGCVLSLFATDLNTLLAARFVQGIGAASGRVLSVAIVRDRFAGREMARVMSINMGIFITVPIFAPAIGSVILLASGRQGLFVAMLLAGLALGFWFLRRMPETLAPEHKMPFSAARILRAMGTVATNRITVGYATAVGLMFGCVMAMVGSSQQIFTETFGLGHLFPLAFALVASAQGVAAIVNSALVGRFGMRRISHLSVVVLTTLGLLQLIFAWSFDGRPPLLLFGLILACSQFLLGLAFPNFNALAMEPLGRVAGTGSSLVGVYTTVMGSLCGLAIGAAFDGTVLPITAGYLALTIAALAVILVTERGRLFGAHHSAAPGGSPPTGGT